MRLPLASRRRLSITAALAAVVPLAGVTAAAHAAQPNTTQQASQRILTYVNKCVDVRGAHTDDGTPIDEWGCNGTVAQDFTIVPLGNGTVNIKTWNGKCVDVRGAKTDDGTPIDEWGCNGTVAQIFTIVPLGNGQVNILTYVNKCVDVRGAKTDDGTPIDEWGCNGTVAQNFVLS